jgi:hypothetical protein
MPSPPPNRAAVGRRDAGLRRVSRLTRWLLAGALALTGAFSAIAAHSFPGKTGNHATSSAGTDQSSQITDSGSGQSDDDTSPALQPPSSTPSAGAGLGSVTSGGS